MRAFFYSNNSSTYGTATYSSVTVLASSSMFSDTQLATVLTGGLRFFTIESSLGSASNFTAIKLLGGETVVTVKTPSNWTFEPILNPRSAVKNFVFTQDAVESISLSSVLSRYVPEQARPLPTLRDFIRFIPEAIIEADDINENFSLASDVINVDSTSERFVIPQYLRLGASHVSSVTPSSTPNTEYENQIMFGYQVKPELVDNSYVYNKVYTESASSLVSLGGGFIKMRTAGPNTEYAELLNRLTINPNSIEIGSQQYFVGNLAEDSRGMFSAVSPPVSLAVLSNSTQTQTVRLLEALGENKILAVECSLRVGVSSTAETTIKVYGTSESVGYSLVMPKSASTSQRIKTKRFKVPLKDDGILTLSLSAQCSLLELRVVGIWK